MEKKRSKAETEKLLSRIQSRLKRGLAAEANLRDEARDDDEFYNGKQYPDAVRNQRQTDGRPCLTVNKLPQFVKKVTNEMRRNRPQIRALPVDDKADVKTAKIITGLLRHIQVNSRADLAYDSASEQTVIGGYGYWRVTTDYVEGEVDLQEIYIKRIASRFSVVLDYMRQEADASDAAWGFVFEDMAKEDFEQAYPDADVVSFDGSDADNPAPGWLTDNSVRVAEYFEAVTEPKTLLLLQDGRKVWEADHDKSDATSVISSRKVPKRCIYWYKTNGAEILEETIFPGELIPIVLMTGDEILVNGQINYKGVVRNAKDPQRMVNYWWTSYTELVAMAPKAPYIGYVGQFANPAQWAASNTQPVPFLEANAMIDGATNAVLPLPQRQQFAGVPTGIEQGLRLANEDMKETTGIYDASLGAQSNETSGIAINARKAEGDTANFHFLDNRNRAIRHCGRIILGLIPHIYDTQRILRILGEDGAVEKMQPINGAEDPEANQDSANDLAPIFDLTVGRYDLVVDSGPSFTTKRQEAAQGMTEFIRVFPQAAPLIGDLYAKGQDWPLANEIGERLKTMLPPGILKADGEPDLPPEIKAKMAQDQQQLQAADAAVHELAEKVKSKDSENQTKLDIAEMDNATKIHIAKINAGVPEDLAAMAQELLALKQLVEAHHEALTQPPAPGPAQAGQGEIAPAPDQMSGPQSQQEMPL